MNQMAQQFSRVTADFIKRKSGKGPEFIKTYCLDNRILIEFNNYLTPIEMEVAGTSEGIFIIKNVRDRYSVKIQEEYIKEISNVFGIKVAGMSVAWNIKDNEGFILIKIMCNSVVKERV